ncbi:hypothetical protein ACET3Z_000786 [Daucus carota]
MKGQRLRKPRYIKISNATILCLPPKGLVSDNGKKISCGIGGRELGGGDKIPGNIPVISSIPAPISASPIALLPVSPFDALSTYSVTAKRAAGEITPLFLSKTAEDDWPTGPLRPVSL